MRGPFSLNTRLDEDRPSTAKIEVVLVLIRHPLLATPVRLSSDNKDNLSIWPPKFGTLSTWQTDDGSPFYWTGMTALLPDETDEGPANATIQLIDVDDMLAGVVIGNPDIAAIDMALVLADAPNAPLLQYFDMEIGPAEARGGVISFPVGMAPFLEEYYPADSMVRSNAPGLFA